MRSQFLVPQFIDVEDKIIGPITTRQFILILGGLFVLFIEYSLLRFQPFLVIGIPTLLLTLVAAFAKINGMPFHFFLLNMAQTTRRPSIRIWDKGLTDAQLKQYIDQVAPVTEVAPAQTSQRLTQSRLNRLSLIVNTGGAYRDQSMKQ
jgi:hypothetical protein